MRRSERFSLDQIFSWDLNVAIRGPKMILRRDSFPRDVIACEQAPSPASTLVSNWAGQCENSEKSPTSRACLGSTMIWNALGIARNERIGSSTFTRVPVLLWSELWRKSYDPSKTEADGFFWYQSSQKPEHASWEQRTVADGRQQFFWHRQQLESRFQLLPMVGNSSSDIGNS